MAPRKVPLAIEALAFLTDTTKVHFYTNEERSAQPCPDCGAKDNAPCWIYRGSKQERKLTDMHPSRLALRLPLDVDAAIERLTKRYQDLNNFRSPWFREPKRYAR